MPAVLAIWGMAQTPPLFTKLPFHRFGVRMQVDAPQLLAIPFEASLPCPWFDVVRQPSGTSGCRERRTCAWRQRSDGRRRTRSGAECLQIVASGIGKL